MKTDKLLKIFKALSDDTRIDVLKIINQHPEISCQELQKNFKLSQPTLSHHFNKLIEADVLLFRKEGTSHFYRLNTELLNQLGINSNKLLSEEG